MVASSKKGSPQADSVPGSGGEDYLDKALSWDKRLELAREKRAQVEARDGPARPTSKRKPWESDTERSDEAAVPLIPEYPDMPPARRAAMIARMQADAERAAGQPKTAPAPKANKSRAKAQPAKIVRLRERAPPEPRATPANPFLQERQADEAVEAISRLITSPAAGDGAAPVLGARFDPILPPQDTRPRGWVWLVAVVCLLAGLTLGAILAVALFLAIGTQVRAPEAAPSQTVVAGADNRPEANDSLPAVVAPPQRAIPAAGEGIGAAPVAPSLPLAGQPVERPGPLEALATRGNAPVPSGPGAEDGVATEPSRAIPPSALSAVDPIPADPSIDSPPEMKTQSAPAHLVEPATLAAAGAPETMPALPGSNVPDVIAHAPVVAAAPLPVEKIAFVSAEAALPRGGYSRPARPVTPDPAFACAGCTLTDAVAVGKTVRLRLPSALARNERVHLRSLLKDAGFARVVPAIEPVPVRSSQVRYFRSEDADAARLLATMTRAELFDLSWFAPRPAEGTIEVLIAVDGVSGALPPG